MKGRIDGPGLVDETAFQVFDRLDKIVIAQIERMTELEAATRKALGGKAVGTGAAELADAVTKSNTALTEQEKVLKEINRLKERNTKVSSDSLRQLVEERAKRSQITKALKDEVVASGKLGQAYASLRKERDLAANSLRNLIVSEKASNREIRRAQKEFDNLNGKVRKADQAIGNFRDNVGNYGTATQSILGLTQQLAGAFGLFSAVQIGQELFQLTKKLDALRFGLEQVTETQEAFNRAQFFIDELAERAGADILVLTGRYTNFVAAAKTTTLTLKQVENVFENVVVAGSALGRSTDDINGALRALEQILSKGKVQAEELRGQLGERLPGAFQILEKALKLGNGELNDLLEVGGLLSTEAIPALSEGLEEAFNLDTIERVETLAAAQARLSNEFSKFVRDLQEGDNVINTTLSGMFIALTAIVGLLREVAGSPVFEAEQRGKAEGFALALREVESEAARTGETLEEVATRLLPRYVRELEGFGRTVSEASARESQSLAQNIKNFFTGANQDIDRLSKAGVEGVNKYRAAIEILKQVAETGAFPGLPGAGDDDDVKTYTNTIEGLRSKLAELRTERDKADIVTQIGDIKRLNVEIKATETQIKKLTDTYKAAKVSKDKFVSEDSISFVKKLVAEYKKARDEVAVGSEAWNAYAQQVIDAEDALQSLKDTAAILSGDLSSIATDQTEALDVESFLNGAGLDALLADFASRAKLSKEELTAEFESIYQRDFDKFKEFEKRKLQELQDSIAKRQAFTEAGFTIGDELATSFAEIQLARLDREEEKQNEIFDNIVSNKDISEEQIAAAELKRIENDKRLAAERARVEKRAFLFKQGLALGEIFFQDSIARAAATATAATLGPVAGPVYAGTANALITASTLQAIGTVLAQSLPAFFFKGKELGDGYEGKGIWGELQREVLVNNAGGVTISPDGATPIDVKSTDIIHESMGAFVNSMKSNTVTAQRIKKGAKRTSDQNISILTGRSAQSNDFDEELLLRTIRKAFSKASISQKFNITNGSVVRKVP